MISCPANALKNYVCIMELPGFFNKTSRLAIHAMFWIFAYALLTYIYGTAYDSFELGAIVIAMLLPVHIAYYYLVTRRVLPVFFKEKYISAALTALAIMLAMAVVYRLTEIFVTDPYINQYYKQRNPSFTWPKMSKGWWLQMKDKGDFVNAVERSNVVVWIGITVKLFALWHERKHAVLQAELTALKGQLHPHFLFNALNNVYALSLDNAPQTPEVILGLSNILRYVIYECSANWVPLQRDVEVLQDYIKLEKLRYEERLDLNMDIPQHLHQWQIAPLLMLPLVENAFKHGVGETIDAPWINMELRVVESELQLRISNSKPEQSLANAQQPGRIGLANVQHRLKLLYPDAHTLRWYDEADCFVVELIIKLFKPQAA